MSAMGQVAGKGAQRLGLGDRQRRLIGELACRLFARGHRYGLSFAHFHGDHIGGATQWDTPDGAAGPAIATFPRARYIGQRIDLAGASFPNERTVATYITDNFRPLLEQGKLEIVDARSGWRLGVRTDLAPGHTAAIQTVWVEDGGESLLFLTDAAGWAVHLQRLCLGAGIRHHAHTEYGDQTPPGAWGNGAGDALLVFQRSPDRDGAPVAENGAGNHAIISSLPTSTLVARQSEKDS